MSKFIYTAKNYAGETKQGEIEAGSERELAKQLRTEGFVLTSSKEITDSQKQSFEIKFLDKFFGIPLSEKMMFTRNLSVMISSGLSLSRSLGNIALQIRNKKFSKILRNIQLDIQAGTSFADGLRKYPAIFNDLFVNMVKVGESSGNLEEVLTILAVQLEKEHEIKNKVKGALTYPAVILVAMVIIGVLMLTYVLPKITGVFTDMNVVLPKSTLFIIALSDFFKNHSVLVFCFLIFFGIFLKFFLKMKAGKKAISFFSINIPGVNNIVIKVNCARFARIYSSLLRSGISVVEALKIISDTLTNYYYKDAILDGMNQIQKGTNLSKVIAKNEKIFPILVTQMLEVGEETGKTEVVLARLAEFYEEEVDQLTKNLSSIVEPVLMIIIGVAVGFFAISMLQPIYGIMGNIA